MSSHIKNIGCYFHGYWWSGDQGMGLGKLKHHKERLLCSSNQETAGLFWFWIIISWAAESLLLINFQEFWKFVVWQFDFYSLFLWNRYNLEFLIPILLALLFYNGFESIFYKTQMFSLNDSQFWIIKNNITLLQFGKWIYIDPSPILELFQAILLFVLTLKSDDSYTLSNTGDSQLSSTLEQKNLLYRSWDCIEITW